MRGARLTVDFVTSVDAVLPPVALLLNLDAVRRYNDRE